MIYLVNKNEFNETIKKSDEKCRSLNKTNHANMFKDEQTLKDRWISDRHDRCQ